MLLCKVHTQSIKNGELCSTSWRVEYVCKTFGIILLNSFVSSPTFIYLIIYLYRHWLSNTYFIIWVIIMLSNLFYCSSHYTFTTGSCFSWLLNVSGTPPSLWGSFAYFFEYVPDFLSLQYGPSLLFPLSF